ncbi:MAG: hypothetical protein JWN66_4893 [Sphingomonas bacterium]|uniref:DUF2336 domain-containing protein n=1 Tax=Sphingomonas bacterium TaxID=1895847 RepID=UPI002622FC60|nr:DUF2336 domain-containing protein [Sphingomonas bacterium]MDB5707777.1 hypothetical protein [Sphingomonas bacterium]
MSIYDGDMDEGTHWGVSQLLARAAAADLRADERLSFAIDDFFLPDESRLDERLRAALTLALAGLVSAVEGAVRQHAARLLATRDAPELSEILAKADTPIVDRLASAGLLRDTELMRELVGRVRQDVLAEALPVSAPEDPDRASLLARLIQNPDGVVATAAMALLAAESRRHGDPEAMAVRTDLPAELHHRLVWWVAAALRERFAQDAGDFLPILDRALADAAMRSVSTHDEGDRLEASAMRLAAALDSRADELAPLLVETLDDHRLSLFVALIGHALGLDYADAREIVLDPASDRLWLVLRALELGRDSIARIGLALSEADPRRDLDSFAEALDGIAATPSGSARAALAPLLLHPDYRAALLALARGTRS